MKMGSAGLNNLFLLDQVKGHCVYNQVLIHLLIVNIGIMSTDIFVCCWRPAIDIHRFPVDGSWRKLLNKKIAPLQIISSSSQHQLVANKGGQKYYVSHRRLAENVLLFPPAHMYLIISVDAKIGKSYNSATLIAQLTELLVFNMQLM